MKLTPKLAALLVSAPLAAGLLPAALVTRPGGLITPIRSIPPSPVAVANPAGGVPSDFPANAKVRQNSSVG